MNVATAKPNRNVKRRSGRPTKEQAGRISDHIIEVATRLFSETSFEATSVDQIVAKARISKQTFYARFESKDALFAAVIRKGSNDVLMPVVTEPGRAGPIETTLVRVGVELSKHAFAPAAIALDRLVAVTNDRGVACSPCGACRQVIYEFGPNATVFFQGADGPKQAHIKELLPEGFRFE